MGDGSSSETTISVQLIPEGRKSMPANGYSTVARWNDPDEQWSVVLENIVQTSPHQFRALMRLLSDFAPRDLLRAGCRFVLTEGSRVVGEGQVVEEP